MTRRLQKKTILFILDDFHIGGLASFVNTYVRYLNDKGYHTIVIGEDGESLHHGEYFIGSEVVSLPQSPFAERHTNLFTYLLYRVHFFWKFIHAYNIIRKKEKIHVIHFNLTWGPIDLLLFAPSVYNYPRVITFYGDFALEHKSRVGVVHGLGDLRLIVKTAGLALAQGVSLAFSSRIIVFSEYAKKLVMQRFRISQKKIDVIAGSINFHEYQLPTSAPQFILDHKHIHLLNISRFENRKGHDILLQAFDILLKNKLPVRLTICGPITGEIYHVLKVYERLKLRDSVSFLHAVTTQEKAFLMRKADIFVMPSKELETFGLTIVEAFACGTPVIGTPVGAIPEILSLVDRRLIARSTKPEHLAASIARYIRLDNKEKDRIKKKCQRVALQYFDSVFVLKRLESLYESISSQRGVGSFIRKQ